MHLELTSFPLCPFVQRAVITLKEKGVPFSVRYIDLNAPPDWFLALSPMGKVPLLQVDGTVLFESAVINEFLDETHPPSMLPATSLERARARAWIEFGSNLIGRQYQMLVAPEQEGFERQQAASKNELRFLEAALGAGPLFLGAGFSLVDAAYAPLFMRLRLLDAAYPTGLLDDLPKAAAWAAALCARPAVQGSVPEGFEGLFRERFRAAGGWVGQFL